MKRLISLLLTFVLLLTMASTALVVNGQTPEEPMLEQIYGGGGKDKTPISNSFIELYNPTDNAINLSGYSLKYGEKTLNLTGTIPANGYFLIVGAAEKTDGTYLTMNLPEADQTCDWIINNKTYTIELLKSDTVIDSVTTIDDTGISKQKSYRRQNHGAFAVVEWEKDKNINQAHVKANAPHNSNGIQGTLYTVSVEASDARVEGFYNNKEDNIKLELSGRYNSHAMNKEGGTIEIVAYNPVNGFAYVVSGLKGEIIAINLNKSLAGEKVKDLTGTPYDVIDLIENFTYGDVTSVAVSPDGKKLAIAIQEKDYQKNGYVAVFSCSKEDGSITLTNTVEVGIQPDMIVFANNNTILTADEGEPRKGNLGTDPKGSVTIVTINNDNSLSADIAYFDKFDDKRDDLTAAGVLIQKGTMPSTDFEPEYIAVVGNTAYVALQEANAIAVLDITANKFTAIFPLGFQNYSDDEKTKIDLLDDGNIEIINQPNVYGIRMPDGIDVIEIGGKTYLLTANEGDSRSDWKGLDNEKKNKNSPTGNVELAKKVTWFDPSNWDGLDPEKAYIFGGRSFSMYEITANNLKLVYDSGSDFEDKTAENYPEYFNASNKNITLDDRSGKKGPEPESVVAGVIGEKTFAFVALERIGGIMVYDITNPENVTFANYINSRDFSADIKGDVSPEGLCFVSAKDSKTGNPMLLAACEVSGTLAVYNCNYKPNYDVTTDNNGTWVQNSDGSLTFISNGHYDNFIGVKVNNKLIDAKNYEAKSGSTIVTLKADYLKTLPVGSHNITILFADGECSTTFEVKDSASSQKVSTELAKSTVKSDKNPQTEDHNNIAFWTLLFFISLAGITSTVTHSKKKNIPIRYSV
ncbi:MAG: hypothetical protein GX241_01040 [Ruminococcaceae bacterium]|nr:hypothetical protein [Oscillospiraceae bacterium]